MRIKTVQNATFIVLLILTTLAFFGLIADFMIPIFWAAVLAILFQPLKLRYLEWTRGRRSLASVLTLLTILVIVILPLVLVGMAVTRESANLYERIASGEIDIQEPLRQAERALPVLNDYLERFNVDLEDVRARVSATAMTAGSYVTSRAIAIGQSALRFTVLLFLMLYVLFFFLRDGERLVDSLVRTLPLGDRRERRLFGKFAEVARATIKGTIVVGVVQGTLGGLLFAVLGVAAPIFWGVVMTVLSLLPAIGSALVWGPAAIILIATGEVFKGVVMIVVGTLVIGLVDNILRPLLVGRDTQMPDFLILLATLGGLAVFDLSGFVIGPIIAAFFLVVWEMFGDEYSRYDDLPIFSDEPPDDAPESGAPNAADTPALDDVALTPADEPMPEPEVQVAAQRPADDPRS